MGSAVRINCYEIRKASMMSRELLGWKEGNLSFIASEGNRFNQTSPVNQSLSALTFLLEARGLLVTFVYICLAVCYPTPLAKGASHHSFHELFQETGLLMLADSTSFSTNSIALV